MLEFSAIFALLAAIAAVVLAFIFIIPEKRREKLNKFGKLLHDTLNFKFLIIEKVLQALYIFATAFVIVYGFFMLFYVKSYPFYSMNRWYGGYGLLLMILGPVAIRIIYELMILVILLVKNVISINNKLKNQNGGEGKDDIFTVPDLKEFKAAPVNSVQNEVPVTPVLTDPIEAPAASVEAPAVCSNCGAVGENGIFCTKCGEKLK